MTVDSVGSLYPSLYSPALVLLLLLLFDCNYLVCFVLYYIIILLFHFFIYFPPSFSLVKTVSNWIDNFLLM